MILRLRRWCLYILPTSWQQFDVEKLRPTLISCLDQQTFVVFVLSADSISPVTLSAYDRGIIVQLALLSYVAQLTSIHALRQIWRDDTHLRLQFISLSSKLLTYMAFHSKSSQVNINALSSPWFTEASSSVGLRPPLEFQEAESLFQVWQPYYNRLFEVLPMASVFLYDGLCNIRAFSEVQVLIRDDMHATATSIENYKCFSSQPLAGDRCISYSKPPFGLRLKFKALSIVSLVLKTCTWDSRLSMWEVSIPSAPLQLCKFANHCDFQLTWISSSIAFCTIRIWASQKLAESAWPEQENIWNSGQITALVSFLVPPIFSLLGHILSEPIPR